MVNHVFLQGLYPAIPQLVGSLHVDSQVLGKSHSPAWSLLAVNVTTPSGPIFQTGSGAQGSRSH